MKTELSIIFNLLFTVLSAVGISFGFVWSFVEVALYLVKAEHEFNIWSFRIIYLSVFLLIICLIHSSYIDALKQKSSLQDKPGENNKC